VAGPDCSPDCRLFSRGVGFVPSEGHGNKGVMLLGEAPGKVEAKRSEPFRGPAGLMLANLLHRLGLMRDDFLIANRTCCQPPRDWMENAPWEDSAVESCRPFFSQTLRDNPQIKVIMPLGNSALHYLLNQKGIGNFHGSINQVHWTVDSELGVADRRSYWVVPSFHPSYLMRGNWSEIQTARFDFQQAVKLATENEFTRRPTDYIEQPSFTIAEEWRQGYEDALLEDPSITLAADIETPMSAKLDEDDAENSASFQIDRISFAYEETKAITMPWEGRYIAVAKQLLAADGELVFWNGDRFDVPRLEAAGAPCTHTIDAQEGWHFLYPDLPKKLGYVSTFFTDIPPWKHLSGAQPEFYSCVDSDALLRIWGAVKKQIKDGGRWPSFQRDIVEVNKRTARMSANGIAINEPLRVQMVEDQREFKENAGGKVQELIPLDFKPVKPPKGYKRPQPELRCKAGHKITEVCDLCRATLGCEPGLAEAAGMRQIEIEQEIVEEGKTEVRKFLRWARVQDFNLNSPKQMLEYIGWKHGSKAVPKNKKTGKDTIERDQLERLARKTSDPVLMLAVEASEVQSRISHLDGWAPGSDGKVHGVFTNNPATFRFSSKNPNLQNFPSRNGAAQKMRQIVIPGPGYHWLVGRDYRGIEAIQVGIYAADEDYIRLAVRGVHAYLAMDMLGHTIDLGMSDADLDLAIEDARQQTKGELVSGGSQSLYDAAKRTVHGTNYGMSPTMMMRTYPEVFPSVKVATAAQERYFDLFPKVKQWQHDVVDRAHLDARLVNDFGYVRWFWFVKKPTKRKGKWGWERGEDAKAAIATLPQSSAAVIMRQAIGSPQAQRLLQSGRLFLTIHDELIARAEEKKLNWVDYTLKEAMEFPVAQQGGRVFRTTGKRGVNWGEMR